MASQILQAADEVVAQLTAWSADQNPGSTWSSDVITAFGDWAAAQPPEISYDSVIERKDLPQNNLAVYIGFNSRELFDNAQSRCDQTHLYPIAIGIYQRFRPPGSESASGVNEQVSRQVIDDHLLFVEELQSLVYSNRLTSFRPNGKVEGQFDHEVIKKQYLRSVLVVRYSEDS
jgi:hypothetical protein